ncbi:MAG: PspC domain-containing protein [Nocardioides sp.]|nr:PspC domain-containing protein [Nocardioides sp.]
MTETRQAPPPFDQLRRSSADRKIAGVCGGLARHLDVDPTIIRVAAVVLAIFGGAGLVLYGAAWLLVPSDDEERAPLDVDPGGRTVLLVVAGIVALALLFGDAWGGWWIPFPLAVLGLIVLLVVALRRRPEAPAPQPPAPGHRPAAAPETATGTGSDPDPDAQPTDAWYAGAQHDVTQRLPVTSTSPAAPPPAPRRPRRTGPLLFAPTVALVAVAIGVLAILDIYGLDTVPAAYPALAVAIVGAMLVVGAWFGRPGGLIALGLVAVLALGGAVAAQTVDAVADAERLRVTPASADELVDRYEIGNGELTLDLTSVADLAALDGRRVEVTMGAGAMRVEVPSGLRVESTARLSMVGDVRVLDQQRGGFGPSVTSTSGAADLPTLTLDLEGALGEIVVVRSPRTTPDALDTPAPLNDLEGATP